MHATMAQQREVPLMRRDDGHSIEDPVTVEDLHSFIARSEVSAAPNVCRLRWIRCLNFSTLFLGLAACIAVFAIMVKFLIEHFAEIWANGFVAALFLGGLVFFLNAAAKWFAINVMGRFFFTTLKLSKETKEATPVLEWFKVWLPKMMKEQGSTFRSVQPLFRKKDGSTFFTFFRDIRNQDKFELISWVTPGTHFFRFRSRRLGGSIDIAMQYWTGEAKKEGWDQALTVMESIILTSFDPYSQALPYFMDMLSEAQQRFSERDLDCIRFQEWHGWKQMWESTSPDERIAPNFKTLAFYPQQLLTSLEKEVDRFINEPNEVLLRAGLPLKLGFLFHGPPGTGKTNLVRYLAAKYRLEVNIVDCNSGNMDNGQLLHAVVSGTGILLFEDIDNLDAACGRVRESGISVLSNKAEMNKRVTLDGLLNALDGVHRGTQKRILIATTNYPEKLIPSIRRRGRFGCSLKVDYPADAELESMFHYYLTQLPSTEVISEIRKVEHSLGLRLSTAAVVDILAKASLDRSTISALSHVELAANLVKEMESSLRELEQNNRKRLNGTHELLSLLSLQKYADTFYDEGLVDLRYVKLLKDNELKDVGIKSLGDRKKLLDSFQYMEDTPPLSGEDLQKAYDGLRSLCDPNMQFNGVSRLLHSVFDEAQSSELEENFKEQGLLDCTLPELSKLSSGDFETLGLKKLGDRNRLLLRIEKLKEA